MLSLSLTRPWSGCPCSSSSVITFSSVCLFQVSRTQKSGGPAASWYSWTLRADAAKLCSSSPATYRACSPKPLFPTSSSLQASWQQLKRDSASRVICALHHRQVQGHSDIKQRSTGLNFQCHHGAITYRWWDSERRRCQNKCVRHAQWT